MSRAFLSHSSKQKDLVNSIAEKIGLDNCVLDKYHFHQGEPTISEIIRTLKSTDVFVLFLTQESVESEWVAKELEIAKKMWSTEILNHVLILNVDPSFNYLNPLIPEWMRSTYNLKPITDTLLIYKRIDSKLRDITLQNHPEILKKEQIFVGRNQLMEAFESKYHVLNNSKPSAFVISGMEEVGRRKFIRHALGKYQKINEFHQGITITLDSRDSIEDFILRIEDLNSKPTKEVIEKVGVLDLTAKMKYAKELLIKFRDNNEILFIIDKACIIQPSHKISNWFLNLMKEDDFSNCSVCCIISKMRLSNSVDTANRILSFHVPELSSIDTQILFSRYCNEIFNLSLDQAKAQIVISELNGMPGQVFHAVQIINDKGIDRTISELEIIKKYNDLRVYQIILEIQKEGPEFFDLLVFISKIQFVSFELIYKIFGRSDTTNKNLDELYSLGVFDHLGQEREYIQVHYAIVDYILRSKYKISEKRKEKLRQELKNILHEDNDYPDVSQILLTIHSMVEEKIQINEKWLLPSFILRTIIDNYYVGNYSTVSTYANKILEKTTRYDPAIIREIRYWLCQSIARQISKSKNTNHDLFYAQLSNFYGSDYYFLLGFFQRLNGKMLEAEKSFRSAIEHGDNSQKSRRELVNAMLSLKKFEEALALAKRNYEHKPLNAFHIQAYFICLTRRSYLTSQDKSVILDLMNSIKISHDNWVDEIAACMEAEYEYFVKKNVTTAIAKLKECIQNSTYKNYPKKALLHIYTKQGFREGEEKLRQELKSEYETDSLLD